MNNPRNYKVNGKQYAYILNSIEFERNGVNSENLSDKEKIKFVLETFNEEYNYPYNKKCYRNIVERFAQWLRGLPSVISVAFDDYTIANIGKSWRYCQTKAKEAKFVNNWFNYISAKFFQLARIVGVDYARYC